MSAERMQYKRWGCHWLRLSQCYNVHSFGLNDLLGPWKSGNMGMWAGFHLSDWKLDIQAKWVTWQWAKVTCGEKSHLSYLISAYLSFIFRQTELLCPPSGTLRKTRQLIESRWILVNLSTEELLIFCFATEKYHRMLTSSCWINSDALEMVIVDVLYSHLSHLSVHSAPQSLSFQISFAPYQPNRRCVLECSWA